jgi:hypothetical protein
MIILKMANLGLRFLLELSMLASLSYWGFHVGNGVLLKSVLSIATPLAAAILWGLFIAPKASINIDEPLRFIIELAIFASATAALYATGRHSLAFTFVLLYIIHRILMFIWKQ